MRTFRNKNFPYNGTPLTNKSDAFETMNPIDYDSRDIELYYKKDPKKNKEVFGNLTIVKASKKRNRPKFMCTERIKKFLFCVR